MAKIQKRSTVSKRSSDRAPATAAAQALGYSLQYTRLTAMLLEAPEQALCSLEVFDDVGMETGEEQIFVQSKSALGDNPVAGRAISLWKTLSNWIELRRRGFVQIDRALFEIYVSRNVHGKLIDRFSAANTAEAARDAIEYAKKELWGDSPNYAKKKDLPKDLAKYVNPVLEATSELIPIIMRMRLVCGSGSPQSDLEKAIGRHPVSPSKVHLIADHMCGWVKRRVDERLEQKLPAVIAREDFHAAYISFCRAIDRDLILRGLSRKPTEPEKLERLPDVFVQQLSIIDLPFEDQLEAISDFLRACWDRAHWARNGDVDETSFDELDESLRRVWSNHSREQEIEHRSKDNSDRGKLLYSACMRHSTAVQGMTPPAHFVPGCFHHLADVQDLGWHPQYEELLLSALQPA